LFSKRLKKFIDSQHLSIRAFEQKCGVKQGTLSRIIKNNTAITSENLSLILNSWKEIDANWLLTGEGEMLKKSDLLSDQTQIQINSETNKDWYSNALEQANKEIEWQRKQIDLLTSIIKNQTEKDNKNQK